MARKARRLRIHEYLAARSDIEVLKIDADKRKDRPSAPACSTRPTWPSCACRRRLARRGLITNPNTCLIDASTAHRTVPGWTFGLPELAQASATIRASKRIANPGCHASAFILAAPLVDAGLLPRDAAVSATSITGYWAAAEA
jgi:N-acetyl-gamma-glutamyl-phosphate reductase